jgi:hygromycin-B 7''-O-kinase
MSLLRPEEIARALEDVRARRAAEEPFTPAEHGSFPVIFSGDGRVIKIVPDAWRTKFEAEVAMLACAEGQLTVPTPKIVATGALDGMHWVVMTKLEGVRLGDAWGGMTSTHRRRIVRQIGALMASVHALPRRGLEGLACDWRAFVVEQRASCVERHARAGADPAWVAAMPAYLDDVLPALFGDAADAPMSADITDDHALVVDRDGEPVLSGFFDFGDALVGAPAYDLVTPVTFVVRGSRELLGDLLDGLGWSAAARTPALRKRLMAYALLHRFSDLRRDVNRLADARLASLEDVERAMWPL